MSTLQSVPVYSWRGKVSTGIDAATAGPELIRIKEEHGQMAPEVVVKVARSEDSPLHPAFIWDDAEAAEQYRYDQARRLISSIRVQYSKSEPPVPVFVSLRVEDVSNAEATGRAYSLTTDIANDPDARFRLMREAVNNIEGILDRYAWIEELDPYREVHAQMVSRMIECAAQRRRERAA